MPIPVFRVHLDYYFLLSLTINENFVIMPFMNKERNSAEKIINRFGGQSALAQLLVDAEYSTTLG